MNYQTTIGKGHYDKQWKATTYIQLDVQNRQLKVSTFKSSRGILYTSCQAVKIERNSESYMMFGDYNKTVKQFPELSRVNEKVITSAHAASLATIEAFVKEANEFYAKELQEVN